MQDSQIIDITRKVQKRLDDIDTNDKEDTALDLCEIDLNNHNWQIVMREIIHNPINRESKYILQTKLRIDKIKIISISLSKGNFDVLSDDLILQYFPNVTDLEIHMPLLTIDDMFIEAQERINNMQNGELDLSRIGLDYYDLKKVMEKLKQNSDNKECMDNVKKIILNDNKIQALSLDWISKYFPNATALEAQNNKVVNINHEIAISKIKDVDIRNYDANFIQSKESFNKHIGNYDANFIPIKELLKKHNINIKSGKIETEPKKIKKHCIYNELKKGPDLQKLDKDVSSDIGQQYIENDDNFSHGGSEKDDIIQPKAKSEKIDKHSIYPPLKRKGDKTDQITSEEIQKKQICEESKNGNQIDYENSYFKKSQNGDNKNDNSEKSNLNQNNPRSQSNSSSDTIDMDKMLENQKRRQSQSSSGTIDMEEMYNNQDGQQSQLSSKKLTPKEIFALNQKQRAELRRCQQEENKDGIGK